MILVTKTSDQALYVCICMYICSKVITCSRLDITYITLGTSTGMVANPAGVQLNRDFIFPPFPVRASLDNDNLALARQVRPSRFASACVCCVYVCVYLLNCT